MARRTRAATAANTTTNYACAYLRVSDHDQNSLPDQIDLIQSQALRLGVVIPADAIYIDRGESRSLFEKRDALQQMLQRIKDPNCGYVIVWVYSRLYGSVEQQLSLYADFRRAGVRVFDASGHEENTPDHNAKLMGIMNAWKAEGEVLELRKRVYDTHTKKAGRGRLISRPPYGVDVVPLLALPCEGHCIDGGKGCAVPHAEPSEKNGMVWTWNPGQVAILDMIFGLAAEGLPLHALAQRLVVLNITPPLQTVKRGKNVGSTYGGKPWSKSNLRRMILNPFYLGEMVWNQYRTERDGEEKRRVPNPESEWIRKPHALGPVIDPDVIREAHRQVELRRNTREEARVYGVKLWDGFLQCGRCGWNLYPRQRSQRRVDGTRSTLFDYVCNGVYNDYSSCTQNHAIPERWLNAILSDELHRIVPEGRFDVSFQHEEEDTVTPELKVLDAQIVELVTQLESLEKLALAGFYTPEKAVAKKNDLTAQKKIVDDRKSQLLSTPTEGPVVDYMPVELREVADALLDATIPIDERRLTLSRLLDRVVIDKPNARVVLRPYPA